MVVQKLTLIIEAFDKATGTLKRVQKTTEYINKAGNKVINTWKKINGKWRIAHKRIELVSRAARRGAMRFFGLGMGMLFMGMAMKRAIGGFLKAAIKSYKIMGAEQSVFNVKTQELSAAWEFFKFSLIDALSQSELFATLMNWLIGLINWLSQLSEGKRQFIAISLAIGFVIAAMMSLIGQLGLFIIGIGMAGGLKGIMITLLIQFNKLLIVIKSITTWLWANPWALVVIMLISIIALSAILIKQFGGVKGALREMVAGGLYYLSLLLDGIETMILYPLQKVVDVLNDIIWAYNKVYAKPLGLPIMGYIGDIPKLGVGAGLRAWTDKMLPYQEQMTTGQAITSVKDDFIAGMKEIMSEWAETNARAIADKEVQIVSTSNR